MQPTKRLAATLSALALAASSLVIGSSASPAAAAVSPVVAGTFQSEAGCAEDWAPACTNTALTDPDGDGVYTGTFTVPAGEQKFKVALGGTWDQAFGPNNDPGSDVVLNLAAETELTFSFDETTSRIGLTAPLTQTGTAVAGDDAIAQPAVRQGEVENFYFVLTDRFANGDTSNDTGGIEGDRLDHGFDPTNSGFYHGGDIRGLVDQLDYIQGLGTTAIWLTPSFTNRPVQGEGADVSAGYHGYWITDFTSIDPHLGGNEALAELTAAAHERGMKVYFDIITNHTADGIAYAEDRYSYIDTATEPYRDAAGNPIDIAALATSKTWPELDPAVSFAYTPVATPGVVKTPSWLNDLTLYHNRGDSTWTGESVTHGDFVGLDDLMTEHPTVVDGMVEIYKAWMDMGIDGYRIDTAKHVNFEFWEQWAAEISDHADATNPDFFMFGEVYDADPALLAPYSRKTEMDAALDFAFQSRATNFAKGYSTKGLSDLYSADDLYLTSDTSAATIPTFLGNHDMGRIGYLLDGSDNREDRSLLAHQLMYLTRGQPIVYYGDEQGFAGLGGDKSARHDMFATQVAEYVEQPLLDGTTAGSVDRYDTDTRLYTEIADLANLREAHPALADGAQIELHATDGAGVYAFSRVDRDDKVEYVVALNNATSAATVDVTTLTPMAAYEPVYDGTAVTATADGVISLNVPALSAVVLKADRTVAEGAGVPEIDLADGSRLTGDTAPVSATTAENRWAETTFAMRGLGATEWSTIGVAEDDTPRVFADVSDLPTGTVLELRAVTVDAAGTLGGDSALVVVGQDLSLGAQPTEEPGGLSVSVAGSLNAAMGCAGDWDPACASAGLTLDENSGLYTGAFTVPAGDWEWKIAYNDSWTENYGLGGARDGANMTLTTDGREVTFFHDPDTKQSWAVHTDDIVTLPGSWQAALGCPGDWQPECLATAMQPVGDGTWTFTTDQLPAGTYELKVAVGQSWDENYGVDGAPGGGNYSVTVGANEVLTVTYNQDTHVLTFEQTNPPLAGVGQFWAQWLTPTTIAWPGSLVPGADGLTFELRHALDGSVGTDGTGGEAIELTYGALPADLSGKYPHLRGYVGLSLSAEDAARAADLLKGELAVVARSGSAVKAVTGVQIPGVLDSLYASSLDGVELGPVWAGDDLTIRVWAPTAQDVSLLRWPADGSGEPTVVQAVRADDGTWAVEGDRTWEDAQYLWAVDVYVPSLDEVVTNEVTDPYSLGLALNSTRSVAVDLDNPELAPEQWADTPAPTVLNNSARAIWEVHVRDFSISDETVPAADRGTYKAFTHAGSDGMKHLAELAEAGIDTVHLLPTFDIATIEEDRNLQKVPAIPTDAGPGSEEQQAAVAAVADEDAFNWGYDPLHYTTPEGSYATDANQVGGLRSYEFRQMVGALHATGLQVVLDEVYNHTAASGQADKSVLDKVVPGYYHRLSLAGQVETSTCCQNIATEHAAAEKLMVDSVVTWAKDYRVDGFRFDLMGHHSRANMEAVRAALDELTLEADGVDGKSIYLYGEGWNFGEVADNARFHQATQGQLNGTGIGAFNDRLRDAVHGGGPFDEDHRVHQGFGTGLYTDPNGLSPLSADQQRAALLHAGDLIRIGMAGNLEDYSFEAADGTVKRGDELDYNGAPAGYASMPQESVNYVDAHDNETLYDLGIMKLPVDTPMSDRVRMNTVSLATVTLGQSPSFWHAGTEILRSKSLDRDSYNSGDWFNQVDWSLTHNTFGVGLPSAEKNREKWPVMKPLLENPDLKPDSAAMAEAKAQALDLLRLRRSTPLLTLGTAELVHERVAFPNAGDAAVPGLILMSVDDAGYALDVDPALDGVLVAINATPEAITVEVPEVADWALELSPIQADGSDEVVKATTFADGTLTIPARTAALLVAPAEGGPVDPPADTTAPTIAAIPATTGKVGSGMSVQVRATDSSTPLVYSASGLPAGVRMDPATGLISGTPTRPGTYKVTVTVADAAGNRASTTFTVKVQPNTFPRTAPYTLPGDHKVNGRDWRTTCEAYSQTERCRTEIWASVVKRSRNVYTIERGWAFNNLTYLPYMLREQWATNPLGGYGRHSFDGEFTGTDGQKWRTECDTTATGGNACRSYRMTTVYHATPRAGGGYAFGQENTWVFNNIVWFGSYSR